MVALGLVTVEGASPSELVATLPTGEALVAAETLATGVPLLVPGLADCLSSRKEPSCPATTRQGYQCRLTRRRRWQEPRGTLPAEPGVHTRTSG